MPDYGNVPSEDIITLQKAVQVATEVVDRLPSNLPDTWRKIAFEKVLKGILDDWVVNGTESLTPDDLEDLYNLTRVAVDTAEAAPVMMAESAFSVLLQSAMSDWEANWNTDEP